MHDKDPAKGAMGPRLILASASQVRARLLRGAGLDFEVLASGIDEADIKKSRDRSDIETIALRLARAKAGHISQAHREALVIGADQILHCAGILFDKPPDQAAAARQLRALRGRSHRLVTACAVVRGGTVLWEHVSAPALTMRDFSNDFLSDYLARAGADVMTSVGAYKLEALGAQLFDRIDGDYFTILGLPLLPLLSFLRGQGLLRA